MDSEETSNDLCDLDPGKVCDNCCQCIEGEADYIEIPVRFKDGKGE